METKYPNELKSVVTYEICVLGKSTSKTAKEYNIPLKTVEKWVTKYNKDPNVYNTTKLSDAERIKTLEDEVIRLRKSNDVLKKTLILLAKRE